MRALGRAQYSTFMHICEKLVTSQPKNIAEEIFRNKWKKTNTKASIFARILTQTQPYRNRFTLTYMLYFIYTLSSRSNDVQFFCIA